MFPNSSNLLITLMDIEINKTSIGSISTIYANVKNLRAIEISITAKEFYENKTNLFNTTRAVKFHSFLYHNQKIVKIKNELYDVIRTYQSGQFIELYLSKRVFNYE